LAGVPLDTLPPHRQSILGRDPLLGVNLYHAPLVRTLRYEIRSFFRRIRWLLRTELYHRGVRLDFENQLGLTRQESKRAKMITYWTAIVYTLGFRG